MKLDDLFWHLESLELIGIYGHVLALKRLVLADEVGLGIYSFRLEELDLAALGDPRRSEFTFVPHSGKGFTLEEAYRSSVGEGVERVVSLLRRGEYLYASYIDLGDKALGPSDIHLFAEEQYGKVPYRRFTEDMKLGWVEAADLLEGRRVYAPAQVVKFGYVRASWEPPISYTSSGGLASGHGQYAVYRGVLEFVERDAINLGWHSDLPPLKVKIGLREALGLVGVSRLIHGDLKLDVYLWPTDLDVYVVSVHLIDKKRLYYSYLPGCGAGLDFEEALRRALAEAAQAYAFSDVVASGVAKELYYVEKDAPPEQADNLFRIVYYYGYRENLERLYSQFFGRSKEVEPPREKAPERLSHKLSYIYSDFREKEKRLFLVDHTPPELSTIRIYKAFSPDLTQYNSPKYPMFGHPRYYRPPIGEVTRTYEELRKIPVPYP